jgi:hypothetical protein
MGVGCRVPSFILHGFGALQEIRTPDLLLATGRSGSILAVAQISRDKKQAATAQTLHNVTRFRGPGWRLPMSPTKENRLHFLGFLWWNLDFSMLYSESK